MYNIKTRIIVLKNNKLSEMDSNIARTDGE